MSQTNGILERELADHGTTKILLKLIKLLSLKNMYNNPLLYLVVI